MHVGLGQASVGCRGGSWLMGMTTILAPNNHPPPSQEDGQPCHGKAVIQILHFPHEPRAICRPNGSIRVEASRLSLGLFLISLTAALPPTDPCHPPTLLMKQCSVQERRSFPNHRGAMNSCGRHAFSRPLQAQAHSWPQCRDRVNGLSASADI